MIVPVVHKPNSPTPSSPCGCTQTDGWLVLLCFSLPCLLQLRVFVVDVHTAHTVYNLFEVAFSMLRKLFLPCAFQTPPCNCSRNPLFLFASHNSLLLFLLPRSTVCCSARQNETFTWRNLLGAVEGYVEQYAQGDACEFVCLFVCLFVCCVLVCFYLAALTHTHARVQTRHPRPA